MDETGQCHLDIVKSVVTDLKKNQYSGFIIIRSTVPVGTCDKLGSFFSPEFLTEKNYKQDFIKNKHWIFGYPNTETPERIVKFQETISKMLHTAVVHKSIEYENVNFVKNKEAEMVKLIKNCFLATKVGFFNEIYEFCTLSNVNFDEARRLACEDERIGQSHSSVPGHDGKYGFGGTCFPKDMNNLHYEMKKLGMQSHIVKAAIHRNVHVDRKEQDWTMDEGRAVLKTKNK
jgi:UDPglucose 6-dehydrogenase